MENSSNWRWVQEDVIYSLGIRSRMRDGWRPRLSIAAIVCSTSTLDVSHYRGDCPSPVVAHPFPMVKTDFSPF